MTEIFPPSWYVITVGAENFKRRVNFGLIKVTVLSFGNPFGFITIVCWIYRQGSRMAGQELLPPQPSNRGNDWRGVSRCCSVFGVTPTLFPPLGLRLSTTAAHSKRKNKEINEPTKRESLSPVVIVSQSSCLFVTKSTRRFAEIHCLRFKVGRAEGWWGGQKGGGGLNHHPLSPSFVPLLFQQKIDFFSSSPESFWKGDHCVDDLLRGSASLQHMVMRDVQLTELGEEGGAQQQRCEC